MSSVKITIIHSVFLRNIMYFKAMFFTAVKMGLISLNKNCNAFYNFYT
jgi:hypothetical protein